jgi:hypothetical protein
MANNIYEQLRVVGVRFNGRGQIHREDIEKAEPILLKYIQAGPLNVLDTEFDLDDIAVNMKMFKDLQKRKGTLIKDLGEYQLMGYPTYIALVHIPSKSIAYIVRFEVKIVFGKKAVTQVMLWRRWGNNFVEELRIDGMKLTAYVFFKVLFAKYDCIVTDSMQTKMGKRFWQDRIGNAFNYGFPVYYINQVSKEKILLTKDNVDKVEKQYKIWDDTKISEAKKIAICKDEFWEPTQEE